MKRRIHLYHPAMPEELPLVFEELSDKIHVESHNGSHLTLLDTDYYNEEPIDFEELYLLVTTDFETSFTMFLEPYLEEEFSLADHIVAFLPDLPAGLYWFDDIITYAVLRQNESLKQEIQAYILMRTNADVIHTVREFIHNNMNSSVSAKKLYMHRNTLHYRIDNFIEATSINVKTFHGANAIYLLYKY
jgi:hypothetical protein